MAVIVTEMCILTLVWLQWQYQSGWLSRVGNCRLSPLQLSLSSLGWSLSGQVINKLMVVRVDNWETSWSLSFCSDHTGDLGVFLLDVFCGLDCSWWWTRLLWSFLSFENHLLRLGLPRQKQHLPSGTLRWILPGTTYGVSTQQCDGDTVAFDKTPGWKLTY